MAKPTKRLRRSNALTRTSALLLADYLDAAGEQVPARAVDRPEGLQHVKTENTGGRPYVGRLPLLIKILYGAPAFATTSLSFLMNAYMVDFYVTLGVPLPWLTFGKASLRSLDLLTDPLMGWISDRTRSRHGRRIPFQLTGCLVYGAMFFAIFSPPNAILPRESVGRIAAGDPAVPRIVAWWAATYFFFYSADTWCNVPYQALGPELTDAYDERSTLFFIMRWFNQAGRLAAAALPALVAHSLYERGAQRVGVACDGLARGAVRTGHDVFKLVPPTLATANGTCVAAGRCATIKGTFCFEEVGGGATSPRYEATITSIFNACASALEAATSAQPPPPPQCGGLLYSGGAAACTAAGVQCVEFVRHAASSVVSKRTAFSAVAGAFGAYYAVATILMSLRVRERPLPPDAVGRVPLVPAMMRAFKNAPFRMLLVAWSFEALGGASLVAVKPFFVRYVVESDGPLAAAKGRAMDPTSVLGATNVAMLVVTMASAPVWLALSKRFGKYRTWLAASALSIACELLLLIPLRGNPVGAIALSGVNGLAKGAIFLTNSLLADVIDYDQFLHGSRNEASFTVFAVIIPKFLAIFASALPLAVIYALGFVPPRDGFSQPQPPRVRTFIMFAFVFLPAVSSSVALIFKAMFPIRSASTQAAIQAGIAAHDAGDAAVDPLTGKRTRLLKLSTPQDTADAWRYECFSVRSLDRMLESGDVTGLVRHAALHVTVAAALLATALGMTVKLVRDVTNPSLSFGPVTLVIAAGALFVYLVISVARLRCAVALGSGDGGAARHRALVPRVRARVSVMLARMSAALTRSGQEAGGEVGHGGEMIKR